MKALLRTFLAVVCILTIAVCATLILQKAVGTARVDLTQHSVYTLSDGTRKVLAKLNQPVKLTLYYSRTAARKGPKGIRYWNSYYLYVRDLLDEYVGLSSGKLSLQIVDPRRFTDEEDQAIEHGIRRFPISEDENFFFGLVAQSELGKKNTIEFFEPGRQEFVEYDLSKLISGLVQREKKKIGVLSPLPMMGANMSPYMMQMMRMQGQTPPPPWTIVSQLRQEYEVETVAADVKKLPSGLDYLMVVHPKDLPERALYEIDQFVMKGGKLMVFVDPHCLLDRPQGPQRNPYAAMQHKTASDLNALLSTWGVEMEPKMIAADRRLAVKARLRDRVEPLVTYLALGKDCVNADEAITAKLHNTRMLFAGALKRVPGTECSVVPLLSTTPSGTTWTPKSPFELHSPDPEAINRGIVDGREPLMLACRISGKLKTNFPEGIVVQDDSAEGEEDKEKGDGEKKDDKKPPETKDKRLQPVKEAAKEATVLVFADVDMLTDMLAYQNTFFGMAQVGDNASLVLNALEFLGGGGDLIAIRSRGQFLRPFTVVDDIETQAEKATAEEKALLQKKIDGIEGNLRKLGSGADEKNVKLVRTAALAERHKLEEAVRDARKQLRMLNAGKREQIESLKFWLQFHNFLWAPAVVLAIAITLAIVRYVNARYYAARRTQE